MFICLFFFFFNVQANLNLESFTSNLSFHGTRSHRQGPCSLVPFLDVSAQQAEPFLQVVKILSIGGYVSEASKHPTMYHGTVLHRILCICHIFNRE